MDKDIKLLGDKILKSDVKRALIILAEDNSYHITVWDSSGCRYFVVDDKRCLLVETTDELSATEVWLGLSGEKLDYEWHTGLYMRHGEPLAWETNRKSALVQRLQRGVAVADVLVKGSSMLSITYSVGNETVYVGYDFKNDIVKATNRKNPISQKEQTQKILSSFYDKAFFIGDFVHSASLYLPDETCKKIDEIIKFVLLLTKTSYETPKKTAGLTLGAIIGLFDPNGSGEIAFYDNFSNLLWFGYLTDIPKSYLDISDFVISFSDYGNWVIHI